MVAHVYSNSSQLLSPQPLLEFSSSNTATVAISPAGEITALGPGQAYVRARVQGSSQYKEDSVRVIVAQPLSPPTTQ